VVGIKRGDIWLIDLNPVMGSEQRGIRPSLVVSNDVTNEFAPTVCVVPFTSNLTGQRFPINIVLHKQDTGLKVDSLLLGGQIRTVTKERLQRRLSTLKPVRMAQVEATFRLYLGLARAIDIRFFDLEIYAIYRAIWENWGDEAWKVVWRAGEVLFDEIHGQLDLRTDSPLAAMRSLAQYLVDAGYFAAMNVRQTADDELEYEMVDPAITPGAQRIIAEGGVPAHISTAVMFAGLKKLFGLAAEMIGDPEFTTDGCAIERWKLFKE